MTGAFARAAAAIVADPNLGADATYAPEGEAARAVRVVLTRNADLAGPGQGMAVDAWTAMIPIGAVPDRPRKNESLIVGEREFVIDTARADDESASWLLSLRKIGTWA